VFGVGEHGLAGAQDVKHMISERLAGLSGKIDFCDFLSFQEA
jgi:hypothetical protein